jgi:hypothetical protein
MNIALWIVAGLLSVVYLFSGLVKLVTPREKLGNMMHASQWVFDFSPGALKAIGAVEILGAIGLMLPALLDIAPDLVPLAALGLVLVMAGAVAVRLRRNEPRLALADLMYLLLAAFVVIGRFGPESFTG